MTARNYQRIEDFLLRLIELLVSVFTDSEKKEIQEFIDAGEYGLALETLVDVVHEEDKRIPSVSLNVVCELAELMQLDKSVFEDKLRGHVFDG